MSLPLDRRSFMKRAAAATAAATSLHASAQPANPAATIIPQQLYP